MMNLGEQLSEDEIECLIDDVDIDGDGQINYEEFYIMMTSSGKQRQQQIGTHLFANQYYYSRGLNRT